MSHSGVFDSQAKIVILFVLFLIFFLVILYCFKSRETSDRELPAAPAAEEETHEITPLCVDDAALLEEISPGAGTIFQRLFSFSRYDFVLLADAESHVIYEENGVHYISNDIVHDDKLKEGKLDSGFMELIESVVGKV